MSRNLWSERIAAMDPATDYGEIYRILVAHEFPGDFNQALSFALPDLWGAQHRRSAV
jgi:hypothetical protein